MSGFTGGTGLCHYPCPDRKGREGQQEAWPQDALEGESRASDELILSGMDPLSHCAAQPQGANQSPRDKYNVVQLISSKRKETRASPITRHGVCETNANLNEAQEHNDSACADRMADDVARKVPVEDPHNLFLSSRNPPQMKVPGKNVEHARTAIAWIGKPAAKERAPTINQLDNRETAKKVE